MPVQYSGIMVTEHTVEEIDGHIVELHRTYFCKRKPKLAELTVPKDCITMTDTKNMDWCQECKQLRRGRWRWEGNELVRVCEVCGCDVDFWHEE